MHNDAYLSVAVTPEVATAFHRVAQSLRVAADSQPDTQAPRQWVQGYLDGLRWSAAMLDQLASGNPDADALVATLNREGGWMTTAPSTGTTDSVCSTLDRCSERHSYGPGCLLDTGREPSLEDLETALDATQEGHCRVVPARLAGVMRRCLAMPDPPRQGCQMTTPELPTVDDPHVIEEEFCGGCGRSIGYDLRPLTLRCPVCQMIKESRDAE